MDPLVGNAAETDDLELGALLSRCARHDHQALEELYKRVSPLLLAVLVRMLRNRDAAEDALQDVFVRVWLQAGQFEAQRGRALAWMTSIARYRAIDLQRGRRHMVGLEALSERSASAVRAESTLTQRSLERCLGLLSGPQRHCLVLAYQQGLTQDSIACSLGYPLGTVKSWLRRALTSLRQCLDT
jgi:RNA polymerase sigma-70 factor, ECF subfamily